MTVTLWIILGLVIWFGYGFVAAGWYFAYFQGEYPTLAERDRSTDSQGATIALVFGVAALFSASFMKVYRYGWKKWW